MFSAPRLVARPRGRPAVSAAVRGSFISCGFSQVVWLACSGRLRVVGAPGTACPSASGSGTLDEALPGSCHRETRPPPESQMETQWTLKPPCGQLTLCSLTPPDTTQLLKGEVREEVSRPRPGPEGSVGMCPVSAHSKQATHCPLGARGVKPESQGRGPGSPAKGMVRSPAAGEAGVRGGPGRLTAAEGRPGRCARPAEGQPRPQAQGDSRPASRAGRQPAGATSCSPRGCPAQAFPWPRSRTHSPVTRQSWVPLTLFSQGTLCQDRQT